MELGLSNTLLAGDTRLIDHIVGEVKSQGIFDQFRKECIADVDTKPAYQNLRTRVEGSVNSFLSKQIWKPDLNKNQLRETLRKHIHDAPYLDAGVERIVDQVVNPKVYSVFMSQIEDVVYKFLGIEKPKTKEKNGACGLKDLLPKDLDPVSPESDKNSLKDVSLESLDTNDNFNDKENDTEYNEQKAQDEDIYGDKNKVNSENGHISFEEKTSEEVGKSLHRIGSNLNLNISGKSDDKMDEEEEDSPMFEPIDIMNLNESNISNDSHLSGISELTSHRSRSPDFSNELSRDNFDYSNQDSQLSKVSSDSRLSIVTDFGSYNHSLTPIHDASKEEVIKDKYEAKCSKDNFKAIREFDSSKHKMTKNSFELNKSKEIQDYKDTKDFKSNKVICSKENSRDAIDSGIKDKFEHKSSKERSKESDSSKLKSSKEKITKDTKYYKDRSNDKRKVSCHSSAKHDKSNKYRSKEKIDQPKENLDKAKDISENVKDNTNKFKEEKLKDNINKEAKDLKDLYKEKIRELREKKELTEKEKLSKDIKLNKDVKDRKDLPKDRKSNKKDYKSSSSSSSSKNPTMNYHESKSSKTTEKMTDGKDKRPDSKDKTRRDEKRFSKDNKSKSHFSSKIDLSDKSDKIDLKKISKSEKEEKIGKVELKKDIKTSSEKTNGKKDAKNYLQSKSSDRNDKLDNKKDSRNDSLSKDKKRRDDKKSKAKDDHSSLRKNSNDRRSTDRDGSNGSNSKTTQSNNSNSNVTSNKSGSSNLAKESHISNSSSETSDSIEEMQANHSKLSYQSNCKLPHKTNLQLSISDKSSLKNEINNTQGETDMQETILPLKKRPLVDEHDNSTNNEMKIKKPKFAKNIHEAKRLMKIRKQMEKEKFKENKKTDKKVIPETEQIIQSNRTRDPNNLDSMPDDERVQIIEVPDEGYEEPYPEKHPSLILDERAIIMLGAEHCTNDFLENRFDVKPTLSDMELHVRQSLSEIVPNMQLEERVMQDPKTNEKISSNDLHQQSSISLFDGSLASHAQDTETLLVSKEGQKHDSKNESKDDSKDDCKDNYKDRFKDICKDMAVEAEEPVYSPKVEELTISQVEEAAIFQNSKSIVHNEDDNMEQSTKKNIRDHDQLRLQDDNKEVQDNNRAESRNSNKTELQDNEQVGKCILSKTNIIDSKNEYMRIRSSSSMNEDNEDCRYLKTDNEKSEKFSNFLESLELVESSLEDIIESLGGKVVSSIPKSMAPPLPKRKHTSSPLSDIFVNNSDNNNGGHKQTLPLIHEDTVHNTKRRKLVTTKKHRFSNLCNPQGISNGENFVMPLSPESDVSATSEKTPSSNIIKEEKSRNRSSQRYSSDDLYKPRPLFSSSSRRSRRSNQA